MSYGTRAGADAYHLARGNAAWTGSDTLKDQALVRAQDYIRTNYVQRFAEGYDSTAASVEAATYEAALREIVTPGFFSRSYTEAERKVLVAVDSLRWQVVGTGSDGRSMTPTVTLIDALLWPYMARIYGPVVV